MDLSLFEDESFDVVFDKSTLDALKCRGAEATSSSLAHRCWWMDGFWGKTWNKVGGFSVSWICQTVQLTLRICVLYLAQCET